MSRGADPADLFCQLYDELNDYAVAEARSWHGNDHLLALMAEVRGFALDLALEPDWLDPRLAEIAERSREGTDAALWAAARGLDQALRHSNPAHAQPDHRGVPPRPLVAEVEYRRYAPTAASTPQTRRSAARCCLRWPAASAAARPPPAGRRRSPPFTACRKRTLLAQHRRRLLPPHAQAPGRTRRSAMASRESSSRARRYSNRSRTSLSSRSTAGGDTCSAPTRTRSRSGRAWMWCCADWTTPARCSAWRPSCHYPSRYSVRGSRPWPGRSRQAAA